MKKIRKALLIPVNKEGKFLIQDRENYKPPRWGYFGGSIEEGETPVQAVIRESKEELDLDLYKSDLNFLGIFTDVVPSGEKVERHVFLFRTDLKIGDLTIQEGKATKYFSFQDVIDLMKKYSTKADVDIALKVKEGL